MAKISFAPHVTDIAGAIGDIVHARSATGAYVRKRVDPAQPNSARQLAVRGTFTALSSLWKFLDESERAGWRNLALNVIRSGKYGVNYKTTGQRLFINLNSIRALLNLARNVTPPANVGFVPSLVTFSVYANTSTTDPTEGTLGVNFSPSPLQNVVAVYATKPYSAGRNYVSGSQYRFLGTLPAGALTGVDITAMYLAKYGFLPPTFTKISVMVKPLNTEGWVGQPDIAHQVIESL